MSQQIERLISEIRKVPGGYVYYGACSDQICFPLKAGGEIRFSLSDHDESDGEWHCDHYDGALPPGITGFVNKT
jgi:hypothetical protein